MRKWIVCVLMVCAVLVCGCTETFTSMKVKKDGSGTITLKVHASEDTVKQLTAMMGGAAAAMAAAMTEAMASGMQGAGADANAAAVDAEKIQAQVQAGLAEASAGNASLYDEQRVRRIAKLFGKGVTFVSSKESVSKKGWKGFEAQYAFEDVSKVTLCPSIGEVLMSFQQGGGKIPAEVPGYSFVLEEGDEGSTLSIIPPPIEEAADAKSEADVSDFTEVNQSELDAAGAEMNAQMGAAMEAQMMQAMKGKKDSVLIVVDGEVTESNAKYRPKSTPNVILLYHMDFDKVMASPAGKKMMSGGGDIEDVAAGKVPGALAEDPKKTVTVSFR